VNFILTAQLAVSKLGCGTLYRICAKET